MGRPIAAGKLDARNETRSSSEKTESKEKIIMTRVTTIPATRNQFTALPTMSFTKRRTAAYSRVSTDSDEQFTSYEAQIDYYTKLITAREDWDFVDVYTDVDTPNGQNPKVCYLLMQCTDAAMEFVISEQSLKFAHPSHQIIILTSPK